MILSKIKTKINNLVGKRCKFIYYGSRNQKDEFYGVIVKTYPAVFVVTTDNNTKRSYSYNDVLISTLEIIG